MKTPPAMLYIIENDLKHLYLKQRLAKMQYVSIRQCKSGIQLTFTAQLDDLDFADDICLLSHSHKHMQKMNSRINIRRNRYDQPENKYTDDKTKV